MLHWQQASARLGLLAALALLGLPATLPAQQSQDFPPVPADAITSMTQAMPARPAAKPARARKLLVFTYCGPGGFVHGSIPYAAKALEIMGQKTGAFTAVVSHDNAMFEPETLKQFDAVVMDNTTGDPFRPLNFDKLTTDEQAAAQKREARLHQSLLDFVRGGKGLVGIHAATDSSYQWPEYGEMIGGYFDGHPWYADVTETVKVNDPRSPLTRPFRGREFKVTDEIYQFRAPYSRARLHELLSIDTTKTDMNRKGINRTDGDFAISWIHEVGQGRVFYCSLGHNPQIFWTPQLLSYYLRGIQYALGDLKANARPSAPGAGVAAAAHAKP